MDLSSEQSSRDEEGKKEIGEVATWIISSAKSGNGVEQIRDSNLNT